MYRLLAVWDSAGDIERKRLFKIALDGSQGKGQSRLPCQNDVDAMVCVSTIMLAVHTGNDVLLSEIDTSLLATVQEKEAFGCFVTTCLPALVDALHQGALAHHSGTHHTELAMFCGAAVHAWMCQV